MQIEIKAAKRELKGTGASRRLRRSGLVPGIIYGAGTDPISVQLDHKDLFYQFRNETFHASVLALNLEGKKEQVLIRDYQMHPYRNEIQHIDFQRVSQTEKIHVKVPLHFINADIAPGVKLVGGIVAHIMTEVEVVCLAKHLPEFIEVDLANLESGHSIHLSELKLAKGVESVQLSQGNDAAVATIAKPRGGVAEAEEEAAAETTAAPAVPAPAAAA